jgi:hypothetical protein
MPFKSPDPDRRAAVLAGAEALATGRDPAADDAALAPFGDVDPVDWSIEAVRVKNIRRNPAVTVRIGVPRIGATARVLDRELWEQVAAIADRKYGWGDGLPVEITAIVPRTADPVITVNPSDGPCAVRAKTT